MRRALIIGINEYPDAPLTGCVNDAIAVGDLLETNGDGSFNFHVFHLISSEQPIYRSTLREAIKSLFAGDPDIALLYFAGHGFISSTGGYLVTMDSQRYDEGVSMDEVLALANQSKAKNKVIILDCCHSGAMAVPAIGGNGVAQLSEGLTVLTASRSFEAAVEVNGSGAFTSLLTDALRGGASDLRGNITLGALYAYVDEALGAWDARPIFRTNVTGFTALRNVPPKVPLEVMRRITQFFPNPEAEHQLDPGYEDTNPNHDPNKVRIFKDLQKLQSVGLVVPVNADFMYFAAMESKSCRLTALGYQYWRLVAEKKLR
jgi:hypothetical protein